MAAYVNMDIQPEPSQCQNVQQVQKTSQSSPRGHQHRGLLTPIFRVCAVFLNCFESGAFKLVGVSIGLVCILQGTLNIVLRIYFRSQLETDPIHIGCNNQTSYLNLIKERDQLQKQSDNLFGEKIQLQKENDELKRTLNHLVRNVKSGWSFNNSSLYYISKVPASWAIAEQDCRSKGANLVIINSREEQAFVEKLRVHEGAWIGLNDHDVEGHWKWVDDSELTVRFWASQEPNNYNGNENCVITGFEPHDGRPSTGVLNTWNDDWCNSSYSWICEQPVSFKLG